MTCVGPARVRPFRYRSIGGPAGYNCNYPAKESSQGGARIRYFCVMDFAGHKLFLAPLAGVSDSVFRTICKEHGADIVVSEMISAEGLHYNSAATADLLRFGSAERPIGIQLFGARPDHMAEAAEAIQKSVVPDFIDLNAGCPVAKVVKKNGGSALLRDISLFSAMLSALVKAVSVPVTVKIRSGWTEHVWVDAEFATAAQAAGAAAIIVHPRSKSMGFSGHSYWERIAVVKKQVSIPVIGNGDIVTADDAMRMLETTGCDSVMIGRGALGNPWLFSQIKDRLAGKQATLPSASDRVQTALDHVRRFADAHGERKALADMKKHASWYTRGLSGAAQLRSNIFGATSTIGIEQALLSLLSEK